MSKNKTRLIVVIAAIVTIISTFCYAETETNQTNSTNVENSQDAVATSYTDETNVTSSETEENQANEDEVTTTSEDSSYNDNIYEGDLYVFDSDVVMDKLVDGNVFIFGNNVTITGQSSGNMFVFGNNVTFDKAYVQASVFVCGNKVKFDAVSNSLYCASQNLTIDNQFGVYTDIYATCSNLDFDGIVGRNAFLALNSMNLGDNASFYGDLNYSSASEAEIPDGKVKGNINYSKTVEEKNPTIVTYISELAQTLILVIVTFFIVKLFTKAPNTKDCSVVGHPFKTLGVGLLSLVTIFIAILVLLFSMIGATTSLVALAIYCILIALSKTIFAISLSRYICIDKKHRGVKEFLLTILVSVIIWALDLVPFVGGIFGAIFTIFGFGIMIYTPLFKKAKCCKKNEIKEVKEKEETSVVEENKTESTDNNDSETKDK